MGTFIHVSRDVMSLRLVGQANPIEVTSGHKFWSLNRADWVAAGALRVGERLICESGQSVAVESITALPGAIRTYNLDVQIDHRYFVADAAVMVHNVDPCASVNKAVNSDINHAAERAVERAGFADKKSAMDALRELSKKITKDGRFPAGTTQDPYRADSVAVPFGTGRAIYEVKPNGTAILRTWHPEHRNYEFSKDKNKTGWSGRTHRLHSITRLSRGIRNSQAIGSVA